MSEAEETAEKLMTISLSRARPTPRYRRTDRIVNVLKENVAHHMKVDVDEVKISQKLNEEIWSVGKRSRRARISIKVTKDEDGVVTAKLPDEKEEEGEKPEVKEEAKKEEKVEPKEQEKPSEPEAAEEAPEARAEEAKGAEEPAVDTKE
jgi:ribosomal protein L31E